MTLKQVEEIRKLETAKLDALEQIVKVLEALKKTAGEEGENAVEWVMDTLNDN